MNTKQKHVNLLRAAANILQSSMIQDENIADLKIELRKELDKKNASSIEKIDSINWMINFAKERNEKILGNYAETLLQLCEVPFERLLDKEPELNPVFQSIINNHFTPVS